jgi:hypothetical protein
MNSLCGTEGILINLKIYYFAEVAVESMKGESAKQRNRFTRNDFYSRNEAHRRDQNSTGKTPLVSFCIGHVWMGVLVLV